MKIHFFPREASAVAAAAFATVSVFALAPLVRAQQPPPPPPPPAAAPADQQSDIFDAIKKGADKLQKEARKTRDIEPEIRQLIERQDELLHRLSEAKKERDDRDREMIKQFDESKRELTAVLNKQQEVLVELTHAVEKLDAEMKTRHAHPPMLPVPPTPPAPPKPADADAAPGAPLPVTEPAVKPVP